VDCGVELVTQLPELDYVVVAFGSGATMAGLVANFGAERVIGIDAGVVADARETLIELLDGMPEPRCGTRTYSSTATRSVKATAQ
jgi:L-cysteate sulfo-lyase